MLSILAHQGEKGQQPSRKMVKDRDGQFMKKCKWLINISKDVQAYS